MILSLMTRMHLRMLRARFLHQINHVSPDRVVTLVRWCARRMTTTFQFVSCAQAVQKTRTPLSYIRETKMG